MKKCVSAILILLVLCMFVGCSNNNSIIPTEYNEPTVAKTERFTEKPTERPTEAPTQVQPIIESSYTIYEAVTPFASDRAWVTYRDSDNQLCYALIDTNGYLVWSVNQSDLDGWYDIHALAFEDGTYILHQWSINGSKYNIGSGRDEKDNGIIILDKTGKVLFNSTTKGEEYKYYYMGYGDGTALVIENIADFSNNNYYISEIDTISGNIVSQFETTEKSLVSVLDNYYYCGDDIFIGTMTSIGAFWENEYGVYNRKTHTLYSTNSGTFMRGLNLLTSFEDGIALGRDGDKDNSGSVFRVTVEDVSSEDKWKTYIENPTNIGSYSYSNIGENLITDKEGIYDYDGKLLSTFPENWNVKSIGKFNGGFAAIDLEGADKKSYVAIVDKEGNIPYEPMKVDTSYLNSWYGYVMVEIDGTSIILDPNGNKTDRDELDNKYGDYAIGDINVKNGFEKVYDSTAKKYDSYSSATGSSITTVYRLSNYSAIASQEMSEMSKAPTEHNDN